MNQKKKNQDKDKKVLDKLKELYNNANEIINKNDLFNTELISSINKILNNEYDYLWEMDIFEYTTHLNEKIFLIKPCVSEKYKKNNFFCNNYISLRTFRELAINFQELSENGTNILPNINEISQIEEFSRASKLTNSIIVDAVIRSIESKIIIEDKQLLNFVIFTILLKYFILNNENINKNIQKEIELKDLNRKNKIERYLNINNDSMGGYSK